MRLKSKQWLKEKCGSLPIEEEKREEKRMKGKYTLRGRNESQQIKIILFPFSRLLSVCPSKGGLLSRPRVFTESEKEWLLSSRRRFIWEFWGRFGFLSALDFESPRSRLLRNVQYLLDGQIKIRPNFFACSQSDGEEEKERKNPLGKYWSNLPEDNGDRRPISGWVINMGKKALETRPKKRIKLLFVRIKDKTSVA